MSSSSDTPRHSLATRLAHGGLVLAVMVQLGSSLVMHRPRGSDPGNIFFPLHEYSGMAALAFAFLFWAVVVGRRLGTAPGMLFPWFSAERRRAVWRAAGRYLEAARRLALPSHEEAGALPAAVHGLGLLLISFMAVSGTYWYVMALFGLGRSEFVRPFMEMHEAGGNLVWAYLIGHAGLGLLQHVTRNLRLDAMWSLRS